jgi:S-DNA-T family DNA segregation ATPase FtsK/SpoIIIE
MAEDGIVGQYNGSQAREILVTLEQWVKMSGQSEADPVAAKSPAAVSKTAAKSKRNRILPAPEIDDDYEEEVENDEDESESEDGEEADDDFESDTEGSSWNDDAADPDQADAGEDDEGEDFAEQYPIRRASPA